MILFFAQDELRASGIADTLSLVKFSCPIRPLIWPLPLNRGNSRAAQEEAPCQQLLEGLEAYENKRGDL
jgi:hypothetical protein